MDRHASPDKGGSGFVREGADPLVAWTLLCSAGSATLVWRSGSSSAQRRSLTRDGDAGLYRGSPRHSARALRPSAATWVTPSCSIVRWAEQVLSGPADAVNDWEAPRAASKGFVGRVPRRGHAGPGRGRGDSVVLAVVGGVRRSGPRLLGHRRPQPLDLRARRHQRHLLGRLAGTARHRRRQ
jgi:hypothetical protein